MQCIRSLIYFAEINGFLRAMSHRCPFQAKYINDWRTKWFVIIFNESVLQCTYGVVSNPNERRTNMCQLKILHEHCSVEWSEVYIQIFSISVPPSRFWDITFISYAQRQKIGKPHILNSV
jgi:hypothetical protein